MAGEGKKGDGIADGCAKKRRPADASEQDLNRLEMSECEKASKRESFAPLKAGGLDFN